MSARTSLKLGTHSGTSRRDLSQVVASGTSPLVCTRILHQNSSRRDHIFDPCDKSLELSWFDFWE